MRIDTGSELSVYGTHVGMSSDNISALDITGIGSRLITPDGLTVSGFSRVRIADGGFVASGALTSWPFEYGVSTIELSGEATSMAVRGHVTLGQKNQASLYVHDGASINAPTALGYLGPHLKVLLDDGSITLRQVNLSGHLSGTGTLRLSGGDFRNYGTIVAGSSLTIDATSRLKNAGTIDVDNGSIIFQSVYDCLLDNTGTIALRQGNLLFNTINDKTLSNGGDLIADFGVSHIYGSVANGGSVLALADLDIHGNLLNGGVVHNNGEMLIHGNLSNATTGVFNLGAGLAVVEGDFRSNHSTLATELTESDSGHQYGALQVGGEAHFTGDNTLEIKAPFRHTFQLGESFELLTTAGGIFGDLTLGDVPYLDESLAWKLFSDSHTLTLSVGLAGDFNDDSAVDLADYLVWRNSLGSRESFPAADGWGPRGVADGVVDHWDYDIWKENFGNSAAVSAAPSTGTIPEPASWLVFVLSGLVVSVCRVRIETIWSTCCSYVQTHRAALFSDYTLFVRRRPCTSLPMMDAAEGESFVRPTTESVSGRLAGPDRPAIAAPL
ncbi:hypothetical protein NG895_01410 [Aeoliella sp. ICT_H6.2]|uniref:Uncharacterized protein n=1 Tax=Aeoliella straminimaris TaxID=2954799 RepID=A0A9X2JH60_9BACT|nr:hypothetical protein [Aeoliella straminimaris]MCO6042554.1 hypothetical protein [Aeoliella straminimaris]